VGADCSYCLHLLEGGVEGVRRRVGLLPHEAVDYAEPKVLQREAEAEHDVVGARHPQGAVGLEDALSRLQLPGFRSRSFPKPFERIELLCPTKLRFRVLLGRGEYELEALR
jgi:hypothetical protein